MSSAFQQFKIMATQPSLTLAGTPQRISSVDLWVTSCEIQAQFGNTGRCYIADSSANCTSTKARALAAEASFTLVGDMFSGRNVLFNLKEIWFDGVTTGNKLVVSYLLQVNA